MPDDYRSELGAAHAQIAQLREELARARASDAPDIGALEKAHAALVRGMPKKTAFVVQLVCTLLAVAATLTSLALNSFQGFGTVGLPVFTMCTLLMSAVLVAVTRSERKKQIDLSARLLEEARQRRRVEAELDALRGRRVRVAGDTSARVEEEELDEESDVSRSQSPPQAGRR